MTVSILELEQEVLQQLGTPAKLWKVTATHIPNTIDYRVNVWIEREVENALAPEKFISDSFFVSWDGGKVVASNPTIERKYDVS